MWQCWMEDYQDSNEDNLMSKFAGKFIVLDGGDGKDFLFGRDDGSCVRP